MTTANFDALKVGDEIPSLITEPVSRLTLALYATGSGDHHPLHLDQDYVRSKGIPDVFAHGMLGMAYLGRMLTQWVPQEAIRSFGVRYGHHPGWRALGVHRQSGRETGAGRRKMCSPRVDLRQRAGRGKA